MVSKIKISIIYTKETIRSIHNGTNDCNKDDILDEIIKYTSWSDKINMKLAKIFTAEKMNELDYN